MLVDSSQQKLQMQEIVKIAVEETRSEYDPQTAFLALIKETTLPDTSVLQIGNTLFIAHRSKNPREGFFRALNADTAQNYLQNSIEFTERAYTELEFDVLTTQFEDPTIMNIFKYIGKDQPENMGYLVEKTEDGAGYRVTVTLGKRRD
jgi:hypothetical protein